tara:strand:+ start:128 stop:484 length:357 start_codon:yes stop_codon:yes gene_type:complete
MRIEKRNQGYILESRGNIVNEVETKLKEYFIGHNEPVYTISHNSKGPVHYLNIKFKGQQAGSVKILNIKKISKKKDTSDYDFSIASDHSLETVEKASMYINNLTRRDEEAIVNELKGN